MSKNMKLIIGLSAGGAAIMPAICVWLGLSISGKTNEAKTAASGFVTLLQEGELERLSLEYYSYSPAENTVYTDEEGVAKVQIVSEQQMVDMFGIEAVMGTGDSIDNAEAEESTDNAEAGDVTDDTQASEGAVIEEEANISDEELLKAIMRHTQMRANVSTVWSNNTNMILQMLIPDLKTWFLSLTDEDFIALNTIESGSDLLKEIESRIESGEIAQQYIVLNIPMIKQNGKWRFEVTEETEHAFFGGLYNLFDQEADETAEK